MSDFKDVIDLVIARLDRIDNHQTKTSDRLGSIDVTLTRQHASLEEHMRRTEIAEGRIEKLATDMDTALMPVKAAKLVGAVAAGVATIYGAIKLLLP